MVLADGTGEEESYHPQQEIGPIIQIFGILLPYALEVHQSWQTNSQGKGSNYTKSIPKPSKKSKESLGKEYRRNLIDKLPKQQVPSSSTVTINPVSWSTPKKESRVVTDGKSPEVLAESPDLVLEDSNHDTQPFDYNSWSKAQILQIRDVENRTPSQTL